MPNEKEITDRKNKIDPEVAMADIEKVFKNLKVVGPGSEMDRAAQLVLQTLQVLRNRVDEPETLKLIYMGNPEAPKVLPDVVLKTVEGLTDGRLTPEKAGEIIDSAILEYIEAFRELGVTPQPSWAFFWKKDR